jgi:hypothetical protein
MKYNGVLTAIWNSVFPNAFLRYGYSFTADKDTVDRCSNLDPEAGYPECFFVVIRSQSGQPPGCNL